MNKQSLSLQNWKCQWFGVDTLYLEEILHVFQGRLNNVCGLSYLQTDLPHQAQPVLLI